MTIDAPVESAPAAPAQLPARTARRGGLRVWIPLGCIVAALGVLGILGVSSSLDFFDTVDQAVAHKAALGTSVFRLEGVVAPGTIHGTARGTTFDLKGSTVTVHVVNTGTPPALFQPNIPVVVVGHFASSASFTFDSDQILVKHSSSYIAAHPGRVVAPNGSVR